MHLSPCVFYIRSNHAASNNKTKIISKMLFSMIVMAALQIATINAVKVGAGERCDWFSGAECEYGLKCIQSGLLPNYRTCFQQAGPGEDCDEPFKEKYVHVCEEGSQCIVLHPRPWPVSGRCFKEAKLGEACEEASDYSTLPVCKDNLVCVVPEKSGNDTVTTQGICHRSA